MSPREVVTNRPDIHPVTTLRLRCPTRSNGVSFGRLSDDFSRQGTDLQPAHNDPAIENESRLPIALSLRNSGGMELILE
jgi:hypothetical protein